MGGYSGRTKIGKEECLLKDLILKKQNNRYTS
jgi:hypothetical protein